MFRAAVARQMSSDGRRWEEDRLVVFELPALSAVRGEGSVGAEMGSCGPRPRSHHIGRASYDLKMRSRVQCPRRQSDQEQEAQQNERADEPGSKPQEVGGARKDARKRGRTGLTWAETHYLGSDLGAGAEFGVRVPIQPTSARSALHPGIPETERQFVPQFRRSNARWGLSCSNEHASDLGVQGAP